VAVLLGAETIEVGMALKYQLGLDLMEPTATQWKELQKYCPLKVVGGWRINHLGDLLNEIKLWKVYDFLNIFTWHLNAQANGNRKYESYLKFHSCHVTFKVRLKKIVALLMRQRWKHLFKYFRFRWVFPIQKGFS